MTRSFFSGLLLLFVAVTVLGQEPFPERDEKPFPPSIREIFGSFDRSLRTQAQALADSTQLLWDSGRFSDAQKDTIAGAVDRLLSGRFRPWPDLGNYLHIINHISTQPDARRLFSRWHEALAHNMQTQTNSRTVAFIENSKLLFLENTLYQTGAVTWKIRNSRPIYDFKNKESIIEVKDADLICKVFADSSVIYNTTAQINFDRNALKGHSGRLTWQRTLLDINKVFAELKYYQIDLTKPYFEADSVSFYHLDYFENPLLGRIRERVLAEVKPEEANFPVFESYQREHVIKNVFPGIHYYGGFTMQGSRLQGASAAGEPALIEIYRGDVIAIAARSKNFVIRPDRILSEKASFTYYIGRDSIYHPGLNLRYLHNQREFSAMRNERGIAKSPFFNTYHRLDMYCEALYWNLDSLNMQFQMVRGVGQPREAIFESHDFFSQSRYHRLQGIDDLNPLSRLSNFARMLGTQEFYLMEYSRFLRREPVVVKQEILNLSFQGFVFYDDDDDRIVISERLYHYLSANARLSDFDVLQIRSVAPVNARYDILTGDLDLFGIEKFSLSDARQVVVHPDDKQITVKANRNMVFAGRLESGLFDFYGKDFKFDYERFSVSVVESDSLGFSVRSFEPDSRGRYEIVRVKNVLEGISGELLIDDPYNKSGRQRIESFPIFSSFNESFVYYESNRLHNAAYKRENTFFQLRPFTLDSLDHASTTNIAFEGIFISGGIFPDFEDFLTVQHDYTLGFSTVTPEGGVRIYNEQAHYSGPISMSSEGLVASGRLEYLGSVVEAERVLMLPDQAKGKARNFSLEGGGEYNLPSVNAQNLDIELKPGQSSMVISNVEEGVSFYDGRVAFKGDLELTPQSLSGAGRLEVMQANLEAGDFVFKEDKLISQNSDMEVMAPSGRQAFVHRNFSAEIDMGKLGGTFKPNAVDANISFPAIDLLAQGYDYDWDIEAGLIEMRSAGREKLPAFGQLPPENLLNYDFSGYEMVFTDRVKDSLKFYAPQVNLDLNDYNLKAEGVPLIRVADAAIFPEGGIVNVDAGGFVRRLENAQIIANTSTRNHKFIRASVEVTSSKRYRADGFYNYADKNGLVREIFFENIGVDNNQKTIAHANIPDSLEFFMAPEFAFFGKTEIKADEKFLIFDGFSKMDIQCPGFENDWFSFKTSIDPNRLMLPIEPGLRNPNRREINVAVMLAGDSLHIYPSILSRQKHYLDKELVSAYGFLIYDESSFEYIISAKEKLADRDLHHNLLRINTRTCIVNAEGYIDLGVDLGRFKLESYGTLNHNLNTDVTDLELVIGLDFFFSNGVMGNFFAAADIPENQPLNLNSEKFRKYLASKTGAATATAMFNQYFRTGAFNEIPAEMTQSVLIGDIKLRWNQPTRSFMSYGNIGVLSLGKNQLIRQMKGNMEVRKLRAGDTFTLMFRAHDATDAGIGRMWYYFHMGNNMLTVLSSEYEFNEAVRKLRPRQRSLKAGDGLPAYSFDLALERRPYDFFQVVRLLRIN